jgi:hypothetical protein
MTRSRVATQPIQGKAAWFCVPMDGRSEQT